jgi:nitrogen fixation-related uncharacterized protein
MLKLTILVAFIVLLGMVMFLWGISVGQGEQYKNCQPVGTASRTDYYLCN